MIPLDGHGDKVAVHAVCRENVFWETLESLKAAGAKLDGSGNLRCTALNDYRVEIPLDDVRRYDVVVAHLLNGKPMSVREKGPLFVIYPFDEQPQLRTTTYFSRCIWQLKAIELL